MFRMIGGVVVYGFGAYGLFTFIQRLKWTRLPTTSSDE